MLTVVQHGEGTSGSGERGVAAPWLGITHPLSHTRLEGRGVYGAPRRGRGAGVKGASGAWSAGWAAVAWSAVSGALVSKRTQFTCLCGECDGGAQGTDRLCCNQEQRAPRAARGWRQRLQHRARPQVQYEGATLPPPAPPNSAHQRYRKRLSTAGVVPST